MNMPWYFLPRSMAGVCLATWAALALPVVVMAEVGSARLIILIAIAAATALAWEFAFSALRNRPPGLHGIATGLIVVILSPADIAIWQLVLMLSLGVLLADLVFGGRGFGFLSPATVTLALVAFSFPQLDLMSPQQTLAQASIPGMVLLVALGLISWRVLLGTALGFAAAVAALGQAVDPVGAVTALAFGPTFLVADPLAAAATNLGRLIYGALAGALCVVLTGGAVVTTEAVVFAALLATIFAPLIDHLVVLAHARRRAVHHG